MNPIVETVGIINLQHSVDPQQNALGEVLLALEQLGRDVRNVQSTLQEHDLKILGGISPSNPALAQLTAYYNPRSPLGAGTFAAVSNSPLTLAALGHPAAGLAADTPIAGVPFAAKIAYVFDRRPERERENQRIFDVFKRYGENERIPPKLESVTFQSSYECLPLQGADMIAWEQYRHALDYLNGKAKTLPRRKQLSRLTRGGRIAMGVASRHSIERIAAHLKNTDPEKLLAVADAMMP